MYSILANNVKMSRCFPVVVLMVFLCSPISAGGATNVTWIGGIGDWSYSSNWSPAAVPNNSGGNEYNVYIDGVPSINSIVSLNMSATINNLTVDLGDLLGINDGQRLTLDSHGGTAGVISNAGNITIDGSANATYFFVSGGDVTLTGGGTATLSNSTTNYITQTVNAGNYLHVFGRFSLAQAFTPGAADGFQLLSRPFHGRPARRLFRRPVKRA